MDTVPNSPLTTPNLSRWSTYLHQTAIFLHISGSCSTHSCTNRARFNLLLHFDSPTKPQTSIGYSFHPHSVTQRQTPPKKRANRSDEMPELPEVEAARRAIEENCLGKKITKALIADDPKVIDGVSRADFEASLLGKTIVSAHRKGKNLWLRLDSPPFPSFQFGAVSILIITIVVNFIITVTMYCENSYVIMSGVLWLYEFQGWRVLYILKGSRSRNIRGKGVCPWSEIK